jgi:GNAT superfamily N-acetyltransferase
MIEFRCEPLGKHHDRRRFDCGETELKSWLLQRARQDQQRLVASVYVFVPVDEPSRIAGFYALSATSIVLNELPEHFARKLPRYPLVPAILLARLARDVRFSGLGRQLLYDALMRAWRSSTEVAAAAIVVDAKNDVATQFYIRHGFEPFPTAVGRLFLPMRTVEETVKP